ncbi:MAG: hypothetical protein ABSE87_04650 [Terracidiphilus sp.]|jgi:hypothetical protein
MLLPEAEKAAGAAVVFEIYGDSLQPGEPVFLPAANPLPGRPLSMETGRSQCLEVAVVSVWLPVESRCHADKSGSAPRRHPLGEGVLIRRARRLRLWSGYL